jgi:uncharacterized protein YegJ (DUF2314 family)
MKERNCSNRLTHFARVFAVLVWGMLANAAERRVIPAGDVRSDEGFYSVVFYYSPNPASDPEATAKVLAERLLPKVAFGGTPSTAPSPPFIGFEEEAAPLLRFPVPDPSYFEHAGRGLTPEDIRAFSATSRASRLVLVAAKTDVWRLGRQFTRLVGEFAATNQAVIWDSATRECFSRKAWDSRRVAPWASEGTPDVTQHITIHLYQPVDGVGYLRAITLGMEKFALPDVVIERLIASDNRPGGNLINLICQSLAEHPVLNTPLRTTFRVDTLKDPTVRKHMESGLVKGATKEATLALLQGIPSEGDPDNPLVELDFRHGKGKTDDERRQGVLSQLWGSEDSITGATHTEEVLAASATARKRLIALRKDFQQGLPPASHLMVKGPFKRDDKGDEWMWVEVTQWDDPETIGGILQNDPFYIRKLQAGAKVTVRVKDAFDYLLVKPDGSKEGNETGRLIEKQSGPVIRK